MTMVGDSWGRNMKEILVVLTVLTGATQSQTDSALEGLPRQPRTDNGYKISPRPCEVSGIQGTCMFVWECLKTEGQHLGMCMDGFMFGSCCVHDTADNMISEHQQTTSKRFPDTTTTTTTLPPIRRKTTYDPFSTVSSYNKDYYQRPKRPPRPPRPAPSIERVGVMASTSGLQPSRPARPTKPPAKSTSSYNWAQPSSHLILPNSQVKIPPRPPGKPPSWSDRAPYFPPVTSNSIDDYNELNMVQTEPESSWQWSTSNQRPTRPPRPPKPNSDLVTFFPTTSSTSTTSTTRSSTTTTTTPTTTTTTTTTTTKRTTTKPRPPPSTAVSVAPIKVPSVSAEQIKASGRSSCGQPTNMLFCSEGRIVNGSRACYGQFPWQVSVRRTSFFGFSSTHRCGGALLNEYWVASAGHCVDDLMISQIRVRMGEWDFSSTTEPNQHIEHKVVKKIVHPKYNFFTYENDLALVKTEKRVRFADNIIPICLPGNDDLLIGEFGTVAGWGRLSEGGVLPSILQYTTVPIVSNEKCKNMFLAAGRHEVIPEIFMCAGYENGSRDSCQGDSGGPLVVHSKEDGRWFLAGIISWGIGCAEPNLPGVCTRISKFREWILENVTS